MTRAMRASPLSAATSRGSIAVGAQTGLEPGEGGQLHVLLAERRQHLLDVAQEHRARPDEQHAGRRQPAPVRVEEVGGAVERDRGLAGTRAARDDEDAGDLGPDRLVLLGLDRRDDVAHAAGAVAFERGEQRAFARDLEAGIGDGPLVEDLVVEAGDLAALLGDEVAAAHDRHRRDRGGTVEGFGDRRPPVDDERRVRLVLDREAADVPARAASSMSRRPNTSGESPMSRSARRRWVTSQAMSRSSRAWWVPPARTSEYAARTRSAAARMDSSRAYAAST